MTVKRVVINWEAAYATNYQAQLATGSDARYVGMNGITLKTM